jgi:hypothetical protein
MPRSLEKPVRPVQRIRARPWPRPIGLPPPMSTAEPNPPRSAGASIQASFETSAPALRHAPPGDLARDRRDTGRSNVGKSSLLNAFAGQRGLARVSRTPGRTQLLNFFRMTLRHPQRDDFEFRWVDLPGYGYAAAPQSVREAFGPMIEGYLRGRRRSRGWCCCSTAAARSATSTAPSSTSWRPRAPGPAVRDQGRQAQQARARHAGQRGIAKDPRHQPAPGPGHQRRHRPRPRRRGPRRAAWPASSPICLVPVSTGVGEPAGPRASAAISARTGRQEVVRDLSVRARARSRARSRARACTRAGPRPNARRMQRPSSSRASSPTRGSAAATSRSSSRPTRRHPVAAARPGQFVMLRGEWGRELLNPRAFSVLHARSGACRSSPSRTGAAPNGWPRCARRAHDRHRSARPRLPGARIRRPRPPGRRRRRSPAAAHASPRRRRGRPGGPRSCSTAAATATTSSCWRTSPRGASRPPRHRGRQRRRPRLRDRRPGAPPRAANAAASASACSRAARRRCSTRSARCASSTATRRLPLPRGEHGLRVRRVPRLRGPGPRPQPYRYCCTDGPVFPAEEVRWP